MLQILPKDDRLQFYTVIQDEDAFLSPEDVFSTFVSLAAFGAPFNIDGVLGVVVAAETIPKVAKSKLSSTLSPPQPLTEHPDLLRAGLAVALGGAYWCSHGVFMVDSEHAYVICGGNGLAPVIFEGLELVGEGGVVCLASGSWGVRKQAGRQTLHKQNRKALYLGDACNKTQYTLVHEDLGVVAPVFGPLYKVGEGVRRGWQEGEAEGLRGRLGEYFITEYIEESCEPSFVDFDPYQQTEQLNEGVWAEDAGFREEEQEYKEPGSDLRNEDVFEGLTPFEHSQGEVQGQQQASQQPPPEQPRIIFPDLPPRQPVVLRPIPTSYCLLDPPPKPSVPKEETPQKPQTTPQIKTVAKPTPKPATTTPAKTAPKATPAPAAPAPAPAPRLLNARNRARALALFAIALN